MITCSMDWDKEEMRLIQQYCLTSTSKFALVVDSDAAKLVRNFDSWVTKISKLEVTAHRTKQTRALQEEIDKFNKALEDVEQLLLIRVMTRS